MIAKISGTVDEIHLDSIILDVAGIGYRVFVTHKTTASCTTGSSLSLYTHHAIRENAMDLYGFMTEEELRFFELLISISGIGPKSALGILNTAPLETLREGITTGDSSYLTKVSGIGKKSAEKIIVELKDKLGALDDTTAKNIVGSGDAIEALTALGYSLHEARTAIQSIDSSLSTEEMVKQALKQLTQ